MPTVFSIIQVLSLGILFVGVTMGESASLSGRVVDADTGSGVPNVIVNIVGDDSGGNGTQTQTDVEGRYAFSSLHAGVYKIRGELPFGPHATTTVQLGSDTHVDNITLKLHSFGQVMGTVVNHNDEPQPGMMVFLVLREYQFGTLRNVFTNMSKTDDRGHYVLGRLRPGIAYFVLAEKRALSLPAISDAPIEVGARRKVIVPTWFGDSDMAGAAPIVLKPSERREDINIKLREAPAYCAQGVLDIDGKPGPLEFSIEEDEPSSGSSEDGEFFVSPNTGRAGNNGMIRVCGLHPGQYRLTAYQTGSSEGSFASFGTTEIAINKEDVRTIRVDARTRISVPGIVTLSGKSMGQAKTSEPVVLLEPFGRVHMSGESELLVARSAVPGAFAFHNLLTGRYSVKIASIPGTCMSRRLHMDRPMDCTSCLQLGGSREALNWKLSSERMVAR